MTNLILNFTLWLSVWLTKTNILISCITTKHVCRRSTWGRGCSIFVVIHILIWDIWPGVTWSLCFTCKKNNIVLSGRFLLTTGFTAPFNNMWTVKLKLNQQMRFLLLSIKCLAAGLSFRPLLSTWLSNHCTQYRQNSARQSSEAGRQELPNIWLTVAKKHIIL